MELIFEYLDIIALATSILAIVLMILVTVRQKRVQTGAAAKFDSLDKKLQKAQYSLKSHEDKLHELQTALYGMSAKLKSLENIEFPAGVTPAEFQALQNEVSLLISKLKAIESADPGSRLYTKAAKLVASGATIEDVMQECELPRAEAELLMSLHASKS